MKIEKQKEISEYLDALRESGITNMFGATPYIIKAFPELSREEASGELNVWMRNFGK